ncbi:hypothetical protein ABE10_25340, partial [Bacillus toyonensis]|nr:hypothetical protein [Bacillus toyonensis]
RPSRRPGERDGRGAVVPARPRSAGDDRAHGRAGRGVALRRGGGDVLSGMGGAHGGPHAGGTTRGVLAETGSLSGRPGEGPKTKSGRTAGERRTESRRR